MSAATTMVKRSAVRSSLRSSMAASSRRTSRRDAGQLDDVEALPGVGDARRCRTAGTVERHAAARPGAQVGANPQAGQNTHGRIDRAVEAEVDRVDDDLQAAGVERRAGRELAERVAPSRAGAVRARVW